MKPEIATLAQRPDLEARLWDLTDEFAPASMPVPGTHDWRTWTDLPFDTAGDVDVPGALSPVRCEPDHGYAVYVERSVWVRHSL